MNCNLVIVTQKSDRTFTWITPYGDDILQLIYIQIHKYNFLIMKKIFNIFILFFLISTMSNYAQFFKGQPETSTYSSGVTNTNYNSRINYSGIQDNNSPMNRKLNNNNNISYSGDFQEMFSEENTGGFFRNSSAGGPGDRPGSGDGIGQEAPLVDGLAFLIACCGILIVVKTVREKQKKPKIIATEVVLLERMRWE